MTNTTEEKATLRERLLFLEQKNEALQLEVSHLTDQNSKLSDQLEVMRKINFKLKQRLATSFHKQASVDSTELNHNKSSPGKMRRAQTAVFDDSPIRKAESLHLHSGHILPPILERDDNIENERNRDHSVGMILDSFKDFDHFDESPTLLKNLSKLTAENTSPITHASFESKASLHFQLEAKKLIEQQERYSQKIEQDELKEIQEMLEGVLNEPGKFQELNNMVNLGPYSPFSKAEMIKAEKYIEGAEYIIKKWTKQLLEVNKNCLAYTKSIEGFGNQLLMDKGFFKNNIELQTLLALISQVMKEHAIYIEVFTQVVESSIESPLKEFYKNTLRSYKEPKRKMQKTLEDFEAYQLKFLAQKKASVSKEGGSPSNVQKSYTAALKVFENARLEYIHCLNDIAVEINVEIIEKLCNFVTGRMVHLTSTYEILHGIEKQVKLFTENRLKKIKMQENLGHEFEKFKTNLAENVCLEYNLPPLPNVIKQGYLFIKPENKEIKKKYCLIGEDGILYWVKEAENSTDEPQFTELANLKVCCVKIKNDTEHIFSFELVDPHQKRPVMIQTESEQSTNDWISTIRNVTEKALFLNGSLDEVPRCSKADLDTKAKNSPTKTIGNLESSPESKQQKGKQLLISNIIKNNVCADCGSKDPSWVSLNLGVTICINCSGVHRQLGPNISKVRSLKLDNLTNVVLRLFSSLPTEGVNAIWEGYIEQTPSLKPNLESSKEKRAEWVRLKYVDRAIVRRLREEDHIGALCKALEEKDILKLLHILVYTKKNLNEKYIIEGRKQTVLHYACAKSSVELVELLVRNGCDVQAEDEDSCKPIERALLSNNIEIVEHLHGNVKAFEV